MVPFGMPYELCNGKSPKSSIVGCGGTGNLLRKAYASQHFCWEALACSRVPQAPQRVDVAEQKLWHHDIMLGLCNPLEVQPGILLVSRREQQGLGEQVTTAAFWCLKTRLGMECFCFTACCNCGFVAEKWWKVWSVQRNQLQDAVMLTGDRNIGGRSLLAGLD